MTIRISFQVCKVLAPNCAGSETITGTFDFEDAAGLTGQVQIQGPLNAINSINDTAFLKVDGIDGFFNINNGGGTVTVTKTFDPGYNVDENINVTFNIVDCAGWVNIDPATGCTNAIMTDQNKYLMDDEGQYLAFVV